jgi:acetoin utilization deacetylase AcuC-like enzyme
MTTLLLTHEACLAHDPGPTHSERAARLAAILDRLSHPDFQPLRREDAPMASKADLLRAHDAAYIDFIFASVPTTGYQPVEVNDVVSDDDGGEVTTLSSRSGEAASRAAGAAIRATEAVMKGEVQNAFCAVRPPGHHALSHKAMGFCVFANVAVAARAAQSLFGAKRVAIVDWDVHHGNGTQQIFEQDPSVTLISLQQLPLWPETGYAAETGCGNILNIPIAPDTPRTTWLQIWQDQVLSRLMAEEFDLLIISAGFDAHRDDPKGSQNLETEDFATLTHDLKRIAELKCGGRVVSVLEGGYDIEASAAASAAHVRALMD